MAVRDGTGIGSGLRAASKCRGDARAQRRESAAWQPRAGAKRASMLGCAKAEQFPWRYSFNRIGPLDERLPAWNRGILKPLTPLASAIATRAGKGRMIMCTLAREGDASQSFAAA